MKFQVFVMVLLMAFVFDAKGTSVRVLGLDSIQKVEAEAEYLLKDSESKEEGYAKAIKLAEVEALRKIGQYAETIVFTDESTGESKEFFTTVSASIMSVDVVEKSISLSGSDLIARVQIIAEYDEADAKSALERYFENEELRHSLEAVNNSLAAIKDSNASQQKKINELKALNKRLEDESDTQASLNSELAGRINSLKNVLYKTQDGMSESYISMLSSIRTYDVFQKDYTSAEMKSYYKAALQALPEAEKDYLQSLVKLVESIEDDSLVTSPVDVKAGKVTFYPVMRWKIDEGSINDFLSLESDRVTKTSSFEDGIGITKVNLNQDSIGLARDNYFVFYEAKVGKTVLRIPVLAPVKYKRRNGSAFEACVYGEFNADTSLGKSLCIVTSMNSYAYIKKSAISKFEHKEAFTHKPSFSVSESVALTIRVVIYKSDFTEVYKKFMRE